MTETELLNVNRPLLGNPYLARTIQGEDIRIDISVDLWSNLSSDAVREKFVWPGPTAESRIWLQRLEDTRQLFQSDTENNGGEDGRRNKTDNYVISTCNMHKWPQEIKDRLIPLSVLEVGAPTVLSARQGLDASMGEDTEHGWNYLDYAFYENPGYPKHVGPYRYPVSLLLSWSDFVRLQIELPQLFNLLYTVDLTERSRKFHDNFATCADFENVRAFNINFHSVYLHEKDWEDFSFLHVTDSHIAYRNDHIDKVIKDANNSFVETKYVNWNDDLRNLITYANEAHRLGNLDFIVFTGDLVDFISRLEILPHRNQSGDITNDITLRAFHKLSENEIPVLNCKTFPLQREWHANDSLSGLLNGNIWEPLDNFEFFHDLVTTFPRSADCSAGDELEVPIFTVLGNHDYREYAYPLCGEAKWQGQIHVAWLNYFDALGLSQDDVMEYSNGICSVYWQDDANKFSSYRDTIHRTYYQLINNAYDFTVELGRHRIVCLDTSHDVGVMQGLVDLVTKGHAEDDWEGGNPDSAAFSEEQIAYLESVISDRQDGAGGMNGLVIVACHSPLVNYCNINEGAPFDFICTTSRLPTPDMRESIRRLLHPEKTPWFAQGSRTDTWVHCGVASDRFPEFMKSITGRVPLVLTGHAHHSVEYIAGLPAGNDRLSESSYFYLHDYYLDNTMGSIDAASHPSTSPEEEPERYPYPDPLSKSVDPESWWRNHQPLLIQTEQLFSRPNQDPHRPLGRSIQVQAGQIVRITHVHQDDVLRLLPPFAARVVIVRAPPGMTPTKFAALPVIVDDDAKCPQRVHYDFYWKPSGAFTSYLVPTGEPDHAIPLVPDYHAYVFIQFNSALDNRARTVRRELLSLRLKTEGCQTTGEYSTQSITLKRAYDEQIGPYYWGAFFPQNPWVNGGETSDEYTMRLKITAFKERARIDYLDGDEIDSAPNSVAHFKDYYTPSAGSLLGYEGGPDCNHSIVIKRPLRNEALTNTSLGTAFPITLESGDMSRLIPVTTLWHANDTAYFLYDYTAFDWATNIGTTPEVSDGSIATIVLNPPSINVDAAEDCGNCLSAIVYEEWSTPVFDRFLIKDQATGTPINFVFGPGEFRGHKCWMSVENARFDSQGAVRFSGSVTFVPMSIQMTGKPQLGKDVQFEPIILFAPRPGPDDYINVLKQVEQVILPWIENEAGYSAVKRIAGSAEVMETLGHLAEKWELFDHAAEYYSASATDFGAALKSKRKDMVLQSLQEVRDIQSKLNEINGVLRNVTSDKDKVDQITDILKGVTSNTGIFSKINDVLKEGTTNEGKVDTIKGIIMGSR